ncbi:uncharacterized protein SCHCODRAFT_02511044 [Schizophyllum commune H4-8]|uniref:Uncharacterized protein n=1 Tax=Schizophyllum commune (strain H4-8 / FGSC 9210) TaxID=578458 RepID=D8QCL7_SCHCM|nr:uncharacterized protein SCHCODRAFT_02511044 [Schizophyllum commune H4-8]KAI5889639.1 hypothetical protein SCHCODRAFT_02511044 [Schizophyllum commune H4-8]
MLRYLWATLYSLISWETLRDASPSPSDCLSAPSLPALAACYANYTVPAAHYDAASYATAQPKDYEVLAFRAAIHRMLDISNGAADCFGTELPVALQSIYSVHSFVDQENGEAYCVLAEKHILNGSYAYGWGFMAVPDKKITPGRYSALQHPRIDVHLSAPHPWFDGPVDTQAASLFTQARARSLFISGRHRRAFEAPSDCEAESPSGTIYYATDPAHSTVAIKDWQDAHGGGGCPTASCAYIQFHGKAETSCPQDVAFISSGLGHDPASLAWYLKTDLPARRLQAALTDAFPAWKISLPTDSPCILTASKTVFGKYVNGVPLGELCGTVATPEKATGAFVHVEQAIEARGEGAYEGRASFLRFGIVQRSVGEYDTTVSASSSSSSSSSAPKRLISMRRAGRDEDVPIRLLLGRIGRAGMTCGAVASAAADLVGCGRKASAAASWGRDDEEQPRARGCTSPTERRFEAGVGVGGASSSVIVRPPRSGRAHVLAATTIGVRSYSEGGWAEYVRESEGVGGKWTPRAASQGVDAGSFKIGRGLEGILQNYGGYRGVGGCRSAASGSDQSAEPDLPRAGISASFSSEFVDLREAFHGCIDLRPLAILPPLRLTGDTVAHRLLRAQGKTCFDITEPTAP